MKIDKFEDIVWIFYHKVNLVMSYDGLYSFDKGSCVDCEHPMLRCICYRLLEYYDVTFLNSLIGLDRHDRTFIRLIKRQSLYILKYMTFNEARLNKRKIIT